jgi:hypothetical protein
MDEALRRHRTAAVAEEQDGDPPTLGSEVPYADELLRVHGDSLSKSRATALASRLALPARMLANQANRSLTLCFVHDKHRA